MSLARPPIDPDHLLTQIEEIVKEHNRWPQRPTEGWNHAVNISIVDRLLREGVAANTILDAVRVAIGRSTYQFINGLNFFSPAIARAHAQSRAQLQLSLNNPNIAPVAGGHGGRRPSVEEHLRARREAAKRAEESDGKSSGGGDAKADLAMDAAENE